jgi:hypothetical protein
MHKKGKAWRTKRLQVRAWERANINQRTDDERYANELYFYGLSPLHWLSARTIQELRAHVAFDLDGETPDPGVFLEPLRADPLSDMERLRTTRDGFLSDARAAHDLFVTRSARHWRSAIDLLEIFVWNSIDVQADLRRRLDGWEAEDHLSQVMTRTAGRGMRIAREVAWLLRGGFPEAARARWRTLHEVAVLTTYLRVRGQEAAERIYAHELLQTLQFNQAARTADGSEEALGEEFAWERNLIDQMLSRYGTEFVNRYGWAADVVGKARPTFRDIEEAAGMGGWRKAYEDATYASHGTSRPIHEELFRRHGRDMFAPTHDGLATPAIMTIRSLLQVSCATLGVFVQSIEEQGGDLKTAILLDAVAREAIDAWASHEWPFWGLKHIPG